MSYQEPPQGYSQPLQPQQSYPQPPMHQTPPPQMQPSFPQPPKRKSKTWLWIIALFVVFFVGIGVGSGMHSGDTTTATATNSTSTQSGGATAPAPTTAPTAKPLAWKTTHSYSGNGAKKTETFTVPDDWKIAYTCKGMSIDGMTATANLQVYVYGSDGSMQDVAVNETCAAGKTDSGTTEEHQGGQVYLDINADSDWTLKVQEQK